MVGFIIINKHYSSKMHVQQKRKRDLKSQNKEEILLMRKERNREKAQIFRQRKKEYINSLEQKIKQLEGKVYELTVKLEKYEGERNLPCTYEADLFAELESSHFCDSPTFSKVEDQLDIDSMCGKQEKLMLLFNRLQVNEHSDSFKYFGKMGKYMKSEIIHHNNLNILEKFLLECNMTPEQVKNDFQNINITQLNKAMKSVAETIIDTKRNFECLKNLSKKAIDRILKNFNSSQIHKFTILSEELASRGNLTAAKIWDLVEETPQEPVQQHVPFY